jgi:hypothetical protein
VVKRNRWPLVLALLATACARGAELPSPVPPPAADAPEERLRTLLTAAEMRESDHVEIAALEERIGPNRFLRVLAELAADSSAAPEARAHALAELGDRGAVVELWAFAPALRASDAGVRAAALAALGRMLPLAEIRVVSLLERGLRDPDPWVQAKALEGLALADPAILRRYLAGNPPAGLEAIARDLVAVAEHRGAPVPRAPDGYRVREDGYGRLEFRPARTWEGWEAEVGELWVAPRGGAPVLLSREVEVVGGVIPAFFSPEGSALVYEAGRRVRVRDLQSGREREAGPGVAPRALPFSNHFVFLAERAGERQVGPAETVLRYDVLWADFDEVRPVPLGTLTARARPEVRGHYSPVRWAVIRETGSGFSLTAEGMESFPLPNPFGLD